MKKTIVVLLILGLLLAGCATSPPSQTPNGPGSSDTTANPADIPQPPANPTDSEDEAPPTLPF